MNTFDKFQLKTNPFRITPAINSEELIWAGFPVVKEKFKTRIERSLQIPNSSLVLNWGEYGSGKTHAARYFNKKSILRDLAEAINQPIPFSLDINFPKSKHPIGDIYTQIIDKLLINELREHLREKGITVTNILDKVTDNIFIQNILKLILDPTVNVDKLKQYLYDTISNADLLKTFSKVGIQRRLNKEGDLTEFIAAFFSLITYQKQAYSCVIVWFDEFEDISILNSIDISNVNNFLKTLVDKTPNNLLIFLNLTQSAMMDIADLGEYLQDAVKSRIKERIELTMPTKEDLILYLKELLNCPIYRETARDDFFPFSEDVIDVLIKDLGDVSLRRFNEAFSLLLESAAFDNKEKISIEYYNTIKDEIIGWKE